MNGKAAADPQPLFAGVAADSSRQLFAGVVADPAVAFDPKY